MYKLYFSCLTMGFCNKFKLSSESEHSDKLKSDSISITEKSK